MGDVTFRKDWTEFRVAGGPPVIFDPGNPPEVPVGQDFAFLPRWQNFGTEEYATTFEARVEGPEGPVEVEYYLDPTIERPLPPGVTAGIGFHFVPTSAGEYRANLKVYARGEVSDTWEVVMCRATEEVPPPTPPPTVPGITFALPLNTMMTVLMLGLVMVMFALMMKKFAR